MHELVLPDLTFPMQTLGRYEVPWDLRRLLYRGGACTDVRIVGAVIDSGKLGRPLAERIELVRQLHELLSNSLERGGRRSTVRAQIAALKAFFGWADETDSPLDLETVVSSYLHWTDSLLQRVRCGLGLKEVTAYETGLRVGSMLDRLLSRSKPIIKTTRLRKPKLSPRAVGVAADKQNLEETFAFGQFLLDISDGLNLAAVWGPLPVSIPIRNGNALVEWSGMKRPETRKAPNPKYPGQQRYQAKISVLRRANYEADRTLRTRRSLVNLRIMAEMFMLMGQPGMNLAQVHQLRMDQWRYKPSTHGYELATYKHRRWGPVVFEIYSDYRRIFDRYLQWRKVIFPDDPDGLLFPLIGFGRHSETPPIFEMLKIRCRCAGIKYMAPSGLRNTNVNWMLRRTNDPDLTADEKQHSRKMLIRHYEKPSQQRAMVQITQYWAKNDPAQSAAGPGSCIGKAPMAIAEIPENATKPDCTTPAGCLFCAHQRDVDSLDHVWSLASYRLLKSFELASNRQPTSKKELPQHPAELAIGRLTSKLAFIRESNAARKVWVGEALLRIEEGRYHPDWAGMIDDEQEGGGDNEPR